jgi:hypothetical protein
MPDRVSLTPSALPNGCPAVGPLVLPDGWLCGCGQWAERCFAFVRNRVLWIRVLHRPGAGFCEVEAITDAAREQIAGRALHPSLTSGYSARRRAAAELRT